MSVDRSRRIPDGHTPSGLVSSGVVGVPSSPVGTSTNPAGRFTGMRFIAVGQQSVGVFAFGQEATGIVAVGQLATGVIAIGQLARGVIVIGQLAIGLVSFGQLVIGPVWATGMLGIGGTTGGLIVAAPFGRVPLRSVVRLRPKRTPRPDVPMWMRLLLLLALAAWVVAAGLPLLHELTRVGGILRSAKPVLTGLR